MLLVKKEEIEMLWRVLYSLKEEERTLIILKDLESLSLDEISLILRKPVGTVKSRLHRARRKAVELGRKALL